MATESVGVPRRVTSSRSVWLLTAGAFFAFFVFGFVDNLKGPTLPVLLRDLEFSYSRGGTMLLGAYFGFLVATIVTGLLADRLGNRVILVAAGVLISGGLFIFSRGTQFVVLAAAMAMIGLGLGAIEVGGNALIVELHGPRRGRYLNLLAVFHGIGSLVVPLYAAQLLQQAFSWRQVYAFTLALSISLALIFLMVRYTRPAAGGSGGLHLAAVGQAGFTRRMGLYYLLITVYVAAELGIAAWIVEFLQQTKGLSVGRSSVYLSLFFFAIMLGRLAGSVLVERIGYIVIILGASLASVVCLAIGIYGPVSVTWFIPLTGLFFSIIFPTTTAAVSHEHPVHTGAIMGLLFAFGGLGGALGPWVIGLASDWVGIQQGFALTIFYCVVMVVALVMLQRMPPDSHPHASQSV